MCVRQYEQLCVWEWSFNVTDSLSLTKNKGRFVDLNFKILHEEDARSNNPQVFNSYLWTYRTHFVFKHKNFINITLCCHIKVYRLDWIRSHIGAIVVRSGSTLYLNPLAPELFFLISAHPVYKMWTIQEPNNLVLWNKLHFEEKKTESIEHV